MYKRVLVAVDGSDTSNLTPATKGARDNLRGPTAPTTQAKINF